MISELEQEKGEVSTPLLVEWHRGTVEAAAALGCDHMFAARLPSALEGCRFR